jgi:hypothetical protein
MPARMHAILGPGIPRGTHVKKHGLIELMEAFLKNLVVLVFQNRRK